MKDEDGVWHPDEDEHGFYDLDNPEDMEAFESGRPYNEYD